MNTATEQKQVATNSVETFARMSEVALSGMERLAALNLSTARESLQQGFAASMSISRAKNGKGQDCENQDDDQDEHQDKVQNRLSGAGVERVTAYVRGVHEIVMESQVEFAELMGNHMSSLKMNGRMSFPGMQVLEKIAQKTSEMTKSNIRNVTEMTKDNVRNLAELTDDVAEDADDVAEETDDVVEESEKLAEKTGRKPQKAAKEAEKG